MLQVTSDTWHDTHDMWHMGGGWGGARTFSQQFQVPSSYGWGVTVTWRYFHKGWVSYLLNHNTICRTAPNREGGGGVNNSPIIHSRMVHSRVFQSRVVSKTQKSWIMPKIIKTEEKKQMVWLQANINDTPFDKKSPVQTEAGLRDGADRHTNRRTLQLVLQFVTPW